MWGMQPARQMSFPPRMEDGAARSARSKAATTLESAVSEAPSVPMDKLLLKWLFFFLFWGGASLRTFGAWNLLDFTCLP